MNPFIYKLLQLLGFAHWFCIGNRGIDFKQLDMYTSTIVASYWCIHAMEWINVNINHIV